MKPVHVLFIGDSLTAGYGLNPNEAYPFVIAQTAKADGFLLEVTNGGVSGDTTEDAFERLPQLLSRPVDIAVIVLGGNDGFKRRDLREIEASLYKIIGAVRGACPLSDVVLAQIEIPPSWRPAYSSDFRAIFSKVARESGAVLGPAILDGVAGNPDFLQSDERHPNSRGQEIIAEKLWSCLKPIVDRRIRPNS